MWGGGEKKGGAVTKESQADRNLFAILLLTAILLWFADTHRYDATGDFVHQYPVYVFIFVIFLVGLVAYYMVDPNTNGMAVPGFIMVLVWPIRLAALLVFGGLIFIPSFRDFALKYQGVKYTIYILFALAIASLMIPQKKQTTTEKVKSGVKKTITAVAGGAAGLVTLPLLGPLAAGPAALVGGGTYGILSSMGL